VAFRYPLTDVAKDYYQILGLNRDASADEVKKAYRRLSKELHPDKNKDKKDAEQKFKEVNEAYEVLGDSKKKQSYDQFGTAGGPGAEGFQGFGNGDFSGFADIFENFFGGGGGGGGRGRQSRGEDIEVRITVDLKDLIADIEHAIEIQKMVSCADCEGSGMEKGSKKVTCTECSGTGQVTRQQQSFFGTIAQRFVCPSCQGAGEVPEKKCTSCEAEGRRQEKVQVNIQVPAGIRDGQTLRIRGQGNAGRQGSQEGDLYVHIVVRPDKRFQREGDDIRSSTVIPVIDAILGTEIRTETVHGPIDLKIPEGTQPEQVLRLKGKGMPVAGASRMGNHFVTVHIEVPKKLSRKEKKLLEDWKKIL
jgi:molecular chaperone DnaJ